MRLGSSLLRTLAAASTLALPLLATAGCSADAQFTTKVASDFPPARHKVSVLGVYKDGRMSPEAWENLAPRLSAPFGASCAPAYGVQLEHEKPALSEAIDDYARANGVADELLDQLAPAATGDLILVVHAEGRVPRLGPQITDTGAMPSGTPTTARSGAGGMSGFGGGQSFGGSPATAGMDLGPGPKGDQFQMTVSLYSVAQHKPVALVTMDYTGKDPDQAVTELAAKLAATIPGSTCGDWNWNAPVDDHRIRELTQR